MPIQNVFPTPIFTKRKAIAASQVQDALVTVYETRERDEKGRQYSASNEPGAGYTSFHSGIDLTLSPALEPCLTAANGGAQEYSLELGIDREQHVLAMRDGWLNIYPPGAFFPRHRHHNCFFSGVMLLAGPPNSGSLKLVDPREGLHMIRPTYEESSVYNSFEVTVQLNPGDMVLFPGWLEHEVSQNLSETDRAVIGFNFVIGYRQGRPST